MGQMGTSHAQQLLSYELLKRRKRTRYTIDIQQGPRCAKSMVVIQREPGTVEGHRLEQKGKGERRRSIVSQV